MAKSKLSEIRGRVAETAEHSKGARHECARLQLIYDREWLLAALERAQRQAASARARLKEIDQGNTA